ncbi:MAG: hypothetical protein IJ008_04455 [Clostridia bacterium]|nr:hypothetical protein [Clostridia bacterium]
MSFKGFLKKLSTLGLARIKSVKEKKEEEKYPLREILFAQTEDGTLVKPFVINSEKTKIKDIETGAIVDLEKKKGLTIKRQVQKALTKLYNTEQKVTYNNMKDFMLDYGILMPDGKSKVMKEFRSHIDSYYDVDFGTFESEPNMIESAISFAGNVGASDLKAFNEQMSSMAVARYKGRLATAAREAENAKTMNF